MCSAQGGFKASHKQSGWTIHKEMRDRGTLMARRTHEQLQEAQKRGSRGKIGERRRMGELPGTRSMDERKDAEIKRKRQNV